MITPRKTQSTFNLICKTLKRLGEFNIEQVDKFLTFDYKLKR